MPLTFAYEKDLDTGLQPYICHENDSRIYNYYVLDEKALDKYADAPYGNYDNITFSNEERNLTTQAVSKIGVKNFPGIGAIGFYKGLYREDNGVLAPIHTTREKQVYPTLEVAEILDGKLHIVISPPDSVAYACYRVLAEQDLFAFEYITYKTECFVDVPPVKGDYSIHCIGYDEDTGIISDDSNALSLSVDTGATSWAPEGYSSGSSDSNDYEARIKALEGSLGDISTILDAINGVEV